MKCPKCKTNNAAGNEFCDKCGASLIKNPKRTKKLPKLTSGEYFAKRYMIIKHIKRDDVGRVYKALDNKLNKIVALRVINPILSVEPWSDIVEKLKQESLLMKDASYTDTKKLYEIGNVENIKYITTAYEEPEAPKRYKKLIISSSIVLIALICLAVFFAIMKMKPEAPLVIGPKKKSIAIMYFENNTGDKSLDHWRKAVSELLITDLSQSRYLKVLNEERLFNILRQLDQLEAQEYSLEVLQEVADKGKVEYILLGSYSKSGNRFRIDIKIQEALTGELIGTDKVEGIGEESIFSMVDDLTEKIKAAFELTPEEIASDIDREVGKITTNSPEAYKYYSEGQRYHNLGNWTKSIQFMKKTVIIDPEFAMAYRSMSQAYHNIYQLAEWKQYLQKALELSDRISDRERYLIQGDAYVLSEKTWDKALKAYNKLLQLYPDDIIGNNNLGVLYDNLEQWDKALAQYDVSIKNKDKSFLPFANTSIVYMSKGMYSKAQEILEHYLNNIVDNPGIHRRLAYCYLCQNKYDLALAEVDKAFSFNTHFFDNSKIKGDVYHLRGYFIKAENEYLKLLKSEEPVAYLVARNRLGALYLLQGQFKKAENQFKQGIDQSKTLGQESWEIDLHLDLAYVYLRLGNYQKAVEKCNAAWILADKADEFSRQRYSLHLKGLSYLEMTSINKAEQTAEILKEIIDSGMIKNHIRYYYHLMGKIELKRNNFPLAQEYFNKVLSLMPYQNQYTDIHAIFMNSLAETYYQAGNIEKARQEYEKILSLTMGRLEYGDVYAKSHYMLGKIYQQKDWRGKAIESYEAFLDLWKNADANIPEIDDAKKQLKILQSN